MKISEILSIYREEINEKLSEIYLSGPESLVTPIQYVLDGKGKRLRPLLTIFSAESCGSSKDNVFSAALAVEVLHNFTLVHDDIMDKDSTRHGKDTVHRKWDDGVAILTGDAMLSLALKLLNENNDYAYRQMKIFVDGLLAVCEGQALDKEYESRSSISTEEYIKMIDLKTGHMLGLSAELGAISAGMSDEICAKINDYGCLIGRAFQIQDDYLDLFGDQNIIGKKIGGDIIKNKKTVMYHLYKENSSIEDSDILDEIYNDSNIQNDQKVSNIKKLFEENEIDLKTRELVKKYTSKTDEYINTLNIDTSKKQYLIDISNKLLSRDF